MTDPHARAEALIAELRANAEAECAAILAEAEADGAALRRAARHRATRAAVDTVAELRRAAARRLARAEAELATAHRYRLNAQGGRAVDNVRPLLMAALARRWADPAGRLAWVASLLAAADRHLPRGTWTIEHPLDCDPATHDLLFSGVEKITPEKPVFKPTADLVAGLRIRVGTAVLDGTAKKLVANRDLVGGLVAAALETQVKARESDARPD